MKLINLFFIILLFNSCKAQNSSSNKLSFDYIPKNLIIEKTEQINIDDDDAEETIVTAKDSTLSFTTEFWIKNNELIHSIRYPWVSINKKLFVDLDDDFEKELIRMQGYEDGIKYIIYDLKGNDELEVFEFYPALLDKNFPKDTFWAYPNNIENLVVNTKKEILSSLKNEPFNIEEHPLPKNQNEIPFLFFNGKSDETSFKLNEINKPDYLTLSTIGNAIINHKNADIPNDLESNGNFKLKVEFFNPNVNGDGKLEDFDIKVNNQLIHFQPEYLTKMPNSKGSDYTENKNQVIKLKVGVENYDDLIISDFNFDGISDFAIINDQGNNSGPLYAFFIQTPNQTFIKDDYLTNEIGFLPTEINNSERTLTVKNIVGCCKKRIQVIKLENNGSWNQVQNDVTPI